MYESKNDSLIPTERFVRRVFAHLAFALILIFLTMAVGITGHLLLEQIDWHDAILNTALIVSGIGPFILPKTIAGKIFLSLYGVLVGLTFMAALGVTLAPLAHRLLHKFHLEDD